MLNLVTIAKGAVVEAQQVKAKAWTLPVNQRTIGSERVVLPLIQIH